MASRCCPSCGFEPDRLEMVPWGDGVQAQPVAPFLCQACGGLALIVLATGEVLPVPPAAWEPVRQRNPTLWQAITTARARILGKDAPHA